MAIRGIAQPNPKRGRAATEVSHGHIGLQRRKGINLLVIVDGFTKFTWIFPTKSTTTKEVLAKMSIIQQTFGNPRRIVTDRGTAFTSEDFNNYCRDEKIQHVLITTGVPRGNRQVERVNRILAAIFTKLSADNPLKWYKDVDRVRISLNSTYERSIDTSPVELLIGVKMHHTEHAHLQSAIEKELRIIFREGRDKLRERAVE